MNINIKLLNEKAKVPTKGSAAAAGYDLYVANDDIISISPHNTLKIDTGIAIEIPEGYFGGIFARSGLSSKEGLRPANCVGVIDSDYRGEVIVALHNDEIIISVPEDQYPYAGRERLQRTDNPGGRVLSEYQKASVYSPR